MPLMHATQHTPGNMPKRVRDAAREKETPRDEKRGGKFRHLGGEGGGGGAEDYGSAKITNQSGNGTRPAGTDAYRAMSRNILQLISHLP